MFTTLLSDFSTENPHEIGVTIDDSETSGVSGFRSLSEQSRASSGRCLRPRNSMPR